MSYLEDVQATIDEINRFLRVKPDALMAHLEAHPEDRYHSLPYPDGGRWLIGRRAGRRLYAIAERILEKHPRGRDLERGTIIRAVENAFVAVFVTDGKPVAPKWVDRMINKAVNLAATGHASITHYVPCVFLSPTIPSAFTIGDVRFISSRRFLKSHESRIIADEAARERARAQRRNETKTLAGGPYTLSPEESAWWARRSLDNLLGYYERFPWVAEVTVPPCDPVVSRTRAEVTVQAYLDLLKLVYGPSADDFRLGRNGVPVPRSGEFSRRDGKEFEPLYRWDSDGAFASKGWFLRFRRKLRWALPLATGAIASYLNPAISTRLSDRWLDALDWYGQGVTERRPAAQIVKFAACLERLTVTERSPIDQATEVVARRTAILASGGVRKRREAAYESAREIYRWRSDLMHGRLSPRDDRLGSTVRVAYKVVPGALVGGLDLLFSMSRAGTEGQKHLEDRFEVLEKDNGFEPLRRASRA